MNEVLFDYDGDDTENEVSDPDIEYCDIQNSIDNANQNSSDDLNQNESNDVEENPFNLTTCLMPDDPTGKIVFNKKKTVLKKKLKRIGKKIFNIAPG